jgi:hypothetical protein
VSAGLRSKTWRLTAIAGVAIGVVYAMSPLTVCFAIAMLLLFRWAASGIGRDERRWIATLLLAALAARVLALAALFMLTDHWTTPFGSFFGDEEYFIKRSIWLRNIALDIPVHGADVTYAFDDYSSTSYLYVLAFIQVLVGPAQYGAHLLGVTFYLAGSVMLYRLVRSTLGSMPALVGMALLLFLPSLFAWSISALKEPLFFLLSASSVVLAVTVVRGPGWAVRIVAIVATVALAAALQTIRAAGAVLCAVSVIGGLAIGALIPRPRLLLPLLVVCPIVVGSVLSRPNVQYAAYTGVQNAARQHWGHVATPGYVYHALDDRFYPDKSEISDMRFSEAARFVVRSLWHYVTVPLPWEIQSMSELAYVPEEIVWYLVFALLPFGVVFAFRRDAIVAGLLFSHAAVAALTVALISGNIGTLVRHRGLALPYLVWLSAVGACELAARWRGYSSSRAVRPSDAPPTFLRTESI